MSPIDGTDCYYVHNETAGGLLQNGDHIGAYNHVNRLVLRDDIAERMAKDHVRVIKRLLVECPPETPDGIYEVPLDEWLDGMGAQKWKWLLPSMYQTSPHKKLFLIFMIVSWCGVSLCPMCLCFCPHSFQFIMCHIASGQL